MSDILLNSITRKISEFYTYTHIYKFPKTNTKKFVVFGQGRTGSTLLFDIINSHSNINRSEDARLTEILYKKVAFPKIFVESKAKKSQAAVYGFKLKTTHLIDTQNHVDPKDFVFKLHDSGWKFIHLTRDNLLYSAISTQIAAKRNLWHSTSKKFEDLPKVLIDCEALIENIKLRERWLNKEIEILDVLSCIKISYEVELLPQEKHQETADKIFSYLEIDSQPVTTIFQKTVDTAIEHSILNYQEVVDAISPTKYSKYLEPIIY